MSKRHLLQLLFLLLTGAITFTSCNDDGIEPPSGFVKPERERLGEIMMEEILNSPDSFPLLENQGSSNYNETIYPFVQQLYDQATHFMRVDAQAPADDKWDIDREWKVVILDDNFSKKAFALPGGNFFITTGFLKSLSNAADLYYIMSFEATLVNNRHILNRLFEEYNVSVMENLVNNAVYDEEIVKDLVDQIDQLNLDADEVVKIADQEAYDEMCQTSFIVPLGSIPIITQYLDASDNWLHYRPSYNFRDDADYLIYYVIPHGCANHGNHMVEEYQINVLNLLP